MISRFIPLFFGLLLSAACAARDEAGTATSPPAEAAERIPTGAVIEPSGFATIRDAPPAPFAPAMPGEPQPLTPNQLAAHQRFGAAAAFQNRVMEEVNALDARLRREQAGNYVSLYFDNEGEPSVVFQFLREGPRTLARYTSNPRFFGRTVRFSQEQLVAASEFMWRTFGGDRVIESTGIGRNGVTVRLSVPEAEFRALLARKGVTLPESVELEYAAQQPASAINQPLPADIARLVRIFPRDDRPLGMLNSIDSSAKVELVDGCFRIPGTEGGLVLFPLGTRLFIDREGFLAFGTEAPGYGRVGEVLVFPGSISDVSAPELAGPVRSACGPGRVLKVNGTASFAAHRAQQSVSANVSAERYFREAYGLSEEEARRAVERCRQRSGAGFCPTTPPRPIERQSDCPAGSSLQHGICRTPEGFIRPIPDWLREFIEE